MTLSIITINYNNVRGLQRTIDSVINQSFRDFEWIIVDGGSTDGSKDLIETVASRIDSNISYWCSERDNGIYHAMNKGILHATKEYLLFLNSGDLLFDKNVLQKVFDCKIGADIVYGDAEMENADGTSYTKQMPKELSIDFFFRDTIIHQATFIKSTIFHEFQYDEDLRVASDRKLWFQCLLAEKSFTHLPFRVCTFDMTGIGTIGKYKLEEEIIINQLFPKSVQKTIKELADYKYAFPQLPHLIYYIKYRRLYRQFFIKVLWLLERITK